MNSINYTYAPLQKLLAVMAIFALVAMPMAQVFAQEAPDEVPAAEVQKQVSDENAGEPAGENANDSVSELMTVSQPETYCETSLANCPRPEPKNISYCHLPQGDNDKAQLHENMPENSWNGHSHHDGDFKIKNDTDKDRCMKAVSHNDYKTVKACKTDETGAPIEGWDMTVSNGDTTYNLETGKDGCVSNEVDSEEGPWVVTEADREGWTLKNVMVSNWGVPHYNKTEDVIGCEFFGYYLAKTASVCEDKSRCGEPAPEYKCTFVNSKEEAQNTCLIPNGEQEKFEVGPSPDKTLQQILDENGVDADVENDQYNYEVWNFASDDTESVTFEVKVLGKQAGNVQEFGYYKKGDTSSFVSVFTIPPTSVGATFSVTVPASVAKSIGFAIKTTGQGTNTWSSEKALNSADGNKDHVAVYNPEDNVYVLAFEDLAMPDPSDEDYNDLVVQISKVECKDKEVGVCQTDLNLLKNGSFEANPVLAHDGKWEIFTNPTNWLVSLSNGLELWANGFYGGASEGDQNAELDGNSPTMITQTVATVPGATYELSFDFSARPDADSVADNSVDALVDNVFLMNATADGSNITTNTWSTHSKTFVAGDASTDIALKDMGTDNSYGSLVDNVCLIKVKDPVVEPKVCTVTLVSGTDANTDGSDDNTTVVEKSDALAKLLAPIHTAWTAAITGASWIWGDNPVASPVNGVSQTFERKFGWGGTTVTSAKLYVAADNSYSSTLNGNASGLSTDEVNFATATDDVYDVTSLINSGNNDLLINVVNKPSSSNPAENPAGLMYKLVVTGTGESENCEVPYVNPEPQPEDPMMCSLTSNFESMNKEFTLSWDTTGASGVTISGIEGDLSVDGSHSAIATSDTTYTLTAKRYVNDVLETKICTLDVKKPGSHGGHGGSSSHKKGKVLGESTDRPEGGVAGASADMPAGAPNTGAGGTSPVVVVLPTLNAILNGSSSVRKIK